MWINRNAYAAYRSDVERIKAALDAYERTLTLRDAEIRDLRHKLEVAEGAVREAVRTSAASSAYLDALRLQLNEIRLERGALLDKLYGLKVVTPVIQDTPTTMPPGTDFDDMGDARAKMEGLADMHDISPLLDVAEKIS